MNIQASSKIPIISMSFSMSSQTRFEQSAPIPYETFSDKKIPRCLFNLVQTVASQHAMRYQKKGLTSFQTTWEFSLDPKTGLTTLSCSDAKIQKICDDILEKQGSVAYPKRVAANLTHLNHIVLNTEEGEILLFNPLCLKAWKEKVFHPFRLKAEFRGSTGLEDPEHAGSLKYPHLLNQIYKQRNQTNPRICLVDPGIMRDEEGQVASVPQFNEWFTLFPESNFSLLFHNSETAKKIKELFKNGLAWMDPMMLRESLKENKAYSELFEKMQDSLIKQKKSQKPERIKIRRILNGLAEPALIPIHISTKKVSVKKLDSKPSFFKKKMPLFDVVVVPNTIFVSFTNRNTTPASENYFRELEKFLSHLAENGSCYFESSIFQDFLLPYYGKEGVEIGMQWLEIRLGYKIIREHISIPASEENRSINCSSIHSDLFLKPPSFMVLTPSNERIREEQDEEQLVLKMEKAAKAAKNQIPEVPKVHRKAGALVSDSSRAKGSYLTKNRSNSSAEDSKILLSQRKRSKSNDKRSPEPRGRSYSVASASNSPSPGRQLPSASASTDNLHLYPDNRLL